MSPAIPPLHRWRWAPLVALGCAGGAGLRWWCWAALVVLGCAGGAGLRWSCWAALVVLGCAGRAGLRWSCWAALVALGRAGRARASSSGSAGRAGPLRPAHRPTRLPSFLPSLSLTHLPVFLSGRFRAPVPCRPLPPGFAGLAGSRRRAAPVRFRRLGRFRRPSRLLARPSQVLPGRAARSRPVRAEFRCSGRAGRARAVVGLVSGRRADGSGC
ncbi:hypothetical protein E0F15_21210 [Frankia sp. B2]|uniref:hypothetical protein n=1 Tax=Frankia sp. B2 TaxID=2541730 RepID=UPI00106D7236|nr:hypothetical protein [Frankia sp. B2]TFE24666.1 hypothetical protein E0F15_21210 [Frankia sp. B2]